METSPKPIVKLREPRYHSCETSLLTGAVGLAGVAWHRHSYDPKRKMRRTALRCLEQMRQVDLP